LGVLLQNLQNLLLLLWRVGRLERLQQELEGLLLIGVDPARGPRLHLRSQHAASDGHWTSGHGGSDHSAHLLLLLLRQHLVRLLHQLLLRWPDAACIRHVWTARLHAGTRNNKISLHTYSQHA